MLPTSSVHWLLGSGRRIRTDISSLVGAGVLPLDEPRKTRADCEAAFPCLIAGKAASPFHRPRHSASATGGFIVSAYRAPTT
jgi:hypothetical protein